MRVLLTGGAGFIGSNVARALRRDGFEVHAPSRAEMELTDAAAVDGVIDRARPEMCIHLAWYAEPGKYLHAKENLALVGSTLRLAERLHESGCKRFVGAGTCFEYDTSQGRLSESSRVAPKSLYATCKLSTFQILEKFLPSFAWARFFYQYGPNEPATRLVPHVLSSLKSGNTVDVTPGEQIRDFLHVEDVADAVVAIAKSDLTGPVNVGSGVEVTVKELVTTLARLAGAEDRVRFGAIPYREGDPMHVSANVEKLASTGFRPRFDLESGLRDTLEKHRS